VTTFDYRCSRSLERQISVKLCGVVTADDISPVRGELTSLMGDDRQCGVLFDLRGVERCAVPTRHVLLELQRQLAERQCRTAYVSNRPRIRGIILWVIHQADDECAKVLGTLEPAERWIQNEGEERTPQVASTVTRLLDRLTGRGATGQGGGQDR